MDEIVIAVTVATSIVVTLSLIVLGARHWLVPAGDAKITINDSRSITAPFGDKLLWALASNGVMLPAACGGRGSCGQCRLTVVSGAGQILPTEAAHISKRQSVAGERLACMVAVRRDLAIRVPDSVLEARQWTCTVQSNCNLTTYLKKLVLKLADATTLQFQSGDYVLVEAPPGQNSFANFAIDTPYRDEWQRQGLFELTATRKDAEVRAYSIANPPHEKGVVTLVVRIATPPPSAPADTPPGRTSSYLFGLAAGDKVTMSGPFGEFHVRESNAEMILIGGGAGIAPLRAMVLDQLLGKHSKRTISFWYGARNMSEICFQDEFDALAARFDNFSWHVALSNTNIEESWTGLRGFIHSVIYEQYLKDHLAPDEAEYYLCGPPLMSSAVIAMLEDLGAVEDNVYFDDFGA